MERIGMERGKNNGQQKGGQHKTAMKNIHQTTEKRRSRVKSTLIRERTTRRRIIR